MARASRLKNAKVSCRVAIDEMREYQELLLGIARKPNVDGTLLCKLASTHKELREQIRVEQGKIKPGSRNVSVREEPIPARRPRGQAIDVMEEAAKSLGFRAA